MLGISGLRIGIYAVIVILAIAACVYIRHEIKVADLAQQQVAEQQAVMDAQKKQHEAIVAGLQQQAADAAQQANRNAAIIAAVQSAPKSSACARSPAMQRLLDGLRSAPVGANQAAPGPGQPAPVSGSAGATSTGH